MIQGLATGYFIWDLVVTLQNLQAFGLGMLAHALSALVVFSFGFVSSLFEKTTICILIMSCNCRGPLLITIPVHSFSTNCPRHSSTFIGFLTNLTWLAPKLSFTMEDYFSQSSFPAAWFGVLISLSASIKISGLHYTTSQLHPKYILTASLRMLRLMLH